MDETEKMITDLYLQYITEIPTNINIVSDDFLEEFTDLYIYWLMTSVDHHDEPVIDVDYNNNIYIHTRSEWGIIKYGFGDIVAIDLFETLISRLKIKYKSMVMSDLKKYGLCRMFYTSYLNNCPGDIKITKLYEKTPYSLVNIHIGTISEKYEYLNKRRSKFCTNCKKFLPKTFFNINNNSYDNLYKHCNNCAIEKDRTIKSKIKSIYRRQIKSSKVRGHEPPTYTIEDFTRWCLAHPKFTDLYDKWIKSGYNSELAPSIDRLDNNQGYTMENIQVTTWRENYTKEYANRDKSILATDVSNSNSSIKFDNLTQAAKFVNMSRTHFSRYLNAPENIQNNKLKLKGYYWHLL